jgi:hypothetical protein
MTHICPARRCGVELPDHLLMCRPHWGLVPPVYQRAVYAAYNHGAGVGSLGLLHAQVDAIRAANDAILPPAPRSAP